MVTEAAQRSAETEISALYAQAEQLIAALQSKHPDRFRLLTLGLAENLCKCWAEHPDPMLAELMLYSRSRSTASQWLLKCGILATALAYQLGWSQRAAFGLTVSALLMDISVLKLIEQRLNNQKLTPKQQKHWQQHPLLSARFAKQQGFSQNLILLAIMQHHEKRDGSGFPNRLQLQAITPSAQLLNLISRFLFGIYPRRGLAAPHYRAVFKQLYHEQRTLDKQHLRALIKLFSPVATAALLQDEEKGLYLVMQRPSQKECWSLKIPQPPQTAAMTLERLSDGCNMREFPAMVLPSIDLAQHWYAGYQELLEQRSRAAWLTPNLTPNPALLSLTAQLQEQQLKLPELVGLINQHPKLGEQIILLANRQTRQAKPINSVKHAVTMIGQERLLPALLSADLQAELQRRKFAGFTWLHSCQQLYIECAAALAASSLFLSPEWAKTLANFSSAGLLCHPQLHTHYLPAQQLKNQRSGRFVQMFISDPAPLRQLSCELAQRWRLPQHLQQSILYHYAATEVAKPSKRTIHQEHLLRLASFLCYELYSGKRLIDTAEAMKVKLLQRLEMKSREYAAAKAAVIESGLLVCALV